MTEELQEDFLVFEGNARIIRVLSKPQVVKDGNGLNLNAGTLAAVMKYTVRAYRISAFNRCAHTANHLAAKGSAPTYR